MIVIKVELWPFGKEEKKREIARTYIHNDGTGTNDSGNYKVRVCRNKYKSDKGYEYPSKDQIYTRLGEVNNYPRSLLNVWQLVIRSLLSAFPEEKKKLDATE